MIETGTLRVDRVVRAVDSRLAAVVQDTPPNLRDATLHLLQAGGKRVRPALVAYAALASGGTRRRGLAHLAFAAEALHSATLLHDDVVDVAATRRGRASVPAAFGNALSVIAGDNLLALALEAVVHSRVDRALSALVRAMRWMVEAEAKQLSLRRSPRMIDEETSEAICMGKTARLFEWCARAGAMAAGAAPEIEDALASFGKNMGVAFQYVDDLLDLSGGDGVGEDLAQGAITLPMVYACRENPSLTPRLLDAVGQREAKDARALTQAILATGAPALARAKVRGHTRAALDALQGLPVTPYRHRLTDLATRLAGRVE